MAVQVNKAQEELAQVRQANSVAVRTNFHCLGCSALHCNSFLYSLGCVMTE